MGDGIRCCGGEGYAGCARGERRGRCSNIILVQIWLRSITVRPSYHIRDHRSDIRRRSCAYSSPTYSAAPPPVAAPGPTLGLALSGSCSILQARRLPRQHAHHLGSPFCMTERVQIEPCTPWISLCFPEVAQPVSPWSQPAVIESIVPPAMRGGRDDMDESTRIRIRYGRATHGRQSSPHLPRSAWSSILLAGMMLILVRSCSQFFFLFPSLFASHPPSTPR